MTIIKKTSAIKINCLVSIVSHYLAAITEQLASAGTVFASIPRSTAFVDASEERMPLAVYEHGC
ncbi:hypothetical protein CDG77_05430 [Nostoc sp. 'Peltigera membranacea cyanobiont' 213]|uniref:hypothetical protein n=1 Tax=Nostoc cyanobionts TaxID=3123326 RepID=UPI000B9581E0|nr:MULTISPECIES: hypothetical protein [unclassified Nostoc]OYD98576.1 hypothetical protein CDG77_05430 [Nostoc sp. 'Peltigera membranacea cyanobiont' 213]